MVEVRVACIGPVDLVRQVQAEAANQPEISVISEPYSSESETTDRVQALQEQVDVILFTGPVPFHIAKASGVLRKPATYVSLSGAGLYVVLAQVLRDGADPSRACIDTFSPEIVREVYREIGIPFRACVKEFTVGTSSQQYVDFHLGNHRSGKTTVAISCLLSASEALRAEGLPTYRVIPTSQSIRDSLRIAYLEGVNFKQGLPQVAISMLELDAKTVGGKPDRVSYDVDRRRLDAHRFLIDGASAAGMSLVRTGENAFLLVAAYSAIQDLTHGFSEAPFVGPLKARFELDAHLGIGLGRTAYQAEMNARLALAESRVSRDAGTACILSEESDVVNLPVTTRVEEYERLVNDDDIGISRQLGIKLGTFIRLKHFSDVSNGNPFTPAQLGDYLELSARSARRLLEALVSRDAACVVGKASTAGRGRPHKLYRLRLPTRDEHVSP